MACREQSVKEQLLQFDDADVVLHLNAILDDERRCSADESCILGEIGCQLEVEARLEDLGLVQRDVLESCRDDWNAFVLVCTVARERAKSTDFLGLSKTLRIEVNAIIERVRKNSHHRVRMCEPRVRSRLRINI